MLNVSSNPFWGTWYVIRYTKHVDDHTCHVRLLSLLVLGNYGSIVTCGSLGRDLYCKTFADGWDSCVPSGKLRKHALQLNPICCIYHLP